MFSKKDVLEYSSMAIEDGNQELKEFYEKHFDSFTKCSATDFENYALVLRELAVKLHDTLNYSEDWKIYASEMGISDNHDIATIKSSAVVNKELPLFLTMTLALQHINGKLANIIKALLSIPRYDALDYLRPHVQKLLGKKNTSENREMVSNKRIQYLENKHKDFSLQSSENMGKHFTSALRSEFSANHSKCEAESLQKSTCSKNSISLPCLNSSEQNYEKLPVQEINFFPSAPLEESLSVFIQHTEQDIDIAKELSNRMKNMGITVKTSYEVEKLIIMDSTGALSAIVQEVDFIVPVVSKQFYEQIHPHMLEKYIESSDALNNRTLYQLINTQYQSNQCVNFKVRPVLLPDMNRGLLTRDVVLFYGLRLWEEFPKLIRILRETKDLIPQYPFY